MQRAGRIIGIVLLAAGLVYAIKAARLELATGSPPSSAWSFK